MYNIGTLTTFTNALTYSVHARRLNAPPMMKFAANATLNIDQPTDARAASSTVCVEAENCRL
jgi:hypothetical protein